MSNYVFSTTVQRIAFVFLALIDAMSFTVQASSLPAKPMLVAPLGTITTVTPAYQWQAVAGATVMTHAVSPRS